ncbi:hypothetical protein [Deinococcus sp.]|uniref:hypothetical protein n=1 Tax=Deinococcus sp. TaxID=47478 RepID=UPI003C7B5CFF
MTTPTDDDRAAPQDHDTRPAVDPRRMPDDNRFGYGSDDYAVGEGNDEAVTGGSEEEMPEAEPS